MTGDLPFPVGADGRFEYDYLDRFWQHPYLIHCDGELAGFALVIEACPVTGAHPCFFMAEFFVLKAYRGRGVGRSAAETIINGHPGRWHIGVIERNAGAARFWSRLRYCRNAQPHRFEGEEWLVYEFVA
ncbi:GNAT family N-acetyltransferase [Devosia geojensis]|uniref:GNAT family N-acetyltransferase n=1 Tax=Devosia geojensis TaxID=443610 RepID=UPI0006960B5B|nr:GNAT family N-acetyltransferase [Devosia geojensis]